jgi:hypothetical protein
LELHSLKAGSRARTGGGRFTRRHNREHHDPVAFAFFPTSELERSDGHTILGSGSGFIDWGAGATPTLVRAVSCRHETHDWFTVDNDIHPDLLLLRHQRDGSNGQKAGEELRHALHDFSLITQE